MTINDFQLPKVFSWESVNRTIDNSSINIDEPHINGIRHPL